MESASTLARRFREVILDGQWIANTNFKQALETVDWVQATQQIGPHNSLAALTFHIDYYIAGILNVFEGGELEIRDKYSFEMPPIQSEGDWQRLTASLWEHAEQFANHVAAMNEAQLNQVFVKEAYGSYRRNIEAVIEHSYYHLGQVSLLKKLIKAAK